MTYLIGGLIGALLGLLIGASIPGIIGFAIFGLIAAASGAMQIGSVETFYWVMLLVLIVLLTAVFMGVAVPAFLVMLPIIMMVSRLFSSWGGGLLSRS